MICIRCKKKTHSAMYTDDGYVCTNCVNMQKYLMKERDFFLCRICGEADAPSNWIGDDALADGLCFGCTFWTRNIEAYELGQKLVIDGEMYYMGKETPGSRGEFRGHGGRRFMIQIFATNRISISTNLWHNGTIPSRFRSQLPDNAKFIQRKEV